MGDIPHPARLEIVCVKDPIVSTVGNPSGTGRLLEVAQDELDWETSVAPVLYKQPEASVSFVVAVTFTAEVRYPGRKMASSS